MPDRDRPNRSNRGLIIGLVLGGGALVVLLMVGTCVGVFYLGGRATHKQGETEKAIAARLPGGVSYKTTTLAELDEEWKRNPATAAARYESNGVEFSGILLEVASNLSNQIYIEVGAGPNVDDDRDAHVFVLSAEAIAALKRAKVGDRIVVRARSKSTRVEPRPWLVADEIHAAK